MIFTGPSYLFYLFFSLNIARLPYKARCRPSAKLFLNNAGGFQVLGSNAEYCQDIVGIKHIISHISV